MAGLHWCSCQHWETTFEKIEKHMKEAHGYNSGTQYERNFWQITEFLERNPQWKLVKSDRN